MLRESAWPVDFVMRRCPPVAWPHQTAWKMCLQCFGYASPTRHCIISLRPQQKLVKTSTSKQLAHVYRQTRRRCVSVKGGKFADFIRSLFCVLYIMRLSHGNHRSAGQARKRFMPVYIEKAEIWLGVTDPCQKHTQTTEYCATQLVLSLKFKLSHAIHIFILSSTSSPLSLRPLYFLSK